MRFHPLARRYIGRLREDLQPEPQRKQALDCALCFPRIASSCRPNFPHTSLVVDSPAP
jgi:hypothetical protein